MKILITESRRNTALICAKSLAKSNHELYGLDNVKLIFNVFSIYYRKNYILPPYDNQHFHADFIALIENLKPDILIPIFKNNWLFKVKDELEKYCSFLIPEEEDFMQLYNKKNCYRNCREFDIPIPEEYSEDDAKNILAENKNRMDDYRVVIKPQHDFGGGRGISYITELEDFDMIKEQTERQYGEVVIQEYIPGDSENMIAVNLLYNKNSRLAGYFGFRKIRQHPNSGGVTALGISSDEQKIVEMLDPMFRKLNWVGPADAELKFDQRDQKPKLMEINPRFTGALAFSYVCGLDFPQLYLKAARNENVIADFKSNFTLNKKWLFTTKYLSSIKHEINSGRNIFKLMQTIPKELNGVKPLLDFSVADSRFKIAKFAEKMGIAAW